MVERLKDAIAKARQRRDTSLPAAPAESQNASRRESGATFTGARQDAETAELWDMLEPVALDPEHLERERVVSFRKSDPSYVTFDVLRTRLLKVMRDTGWSRIGITSPTKGCGKTVIAANLAFSLSRHENFKTMIIDMDLKAPRLASCLGQREKRRSAWFLSGETPPERYLVRLGENLAACLNTERVKDSAELIESKQTARTLADVKRRFKPDIMVYDLPPMLVNDDALAFMPNLDCALLVAAAGESRARDIDECESLLSEHGNFVGILLNKHVTTRSQSYYYGYY